jgi:hypothetical protein
MDRCDEPEKKGNVVILYGVAYSGKLGLLKTTFKDPQQLPKTTTTWTFDFKYRRVNILGCCLVLAS